MAIDRNDPADMQRYSMATVQEIIRRASLRSSESAETVSRQELEAIAAECGISPTEIAQTLAEIGQTQGAVSTGWFERIAERQGPAIIAGGVVGSATAIVAGVIGMLVGPTVAAFVASNTMVAVVVAEGAFARRIRGGVKHATFQAVNLATWGGWATACAVLGQPEMGSVAIAASAASAVMGSALIAAQDRGLGGKPTSAPTQVTGGVTDPSLRPPAEKSSSSGTDARMLMHLMLGGT